MLNLVLHMHYCWIMSFPSLCIVAYDRRLQWLYICTGYQLVLFAFLFCINNVSKQKCTKLLHESSFPVHLLKNHPSWQAPLYVALLMMSLKLLKIFIESTLSTSDPKQISFFIFVRLELMWWGRGIWAGGEYLRTLDLLMVEDRARE